MENSGGDATLIIDMVKAAKIFLVGGQRSLFRPQVAGEKVFGVLSMML
jgi:hypothetical protein